LQDVELHSDPSYGIPGSITAQKRDEMTIETVETLTTQLKL
jgi:hypothetical protein